MVDPPQHHANQTVCWEVPDLFRVEAVPVVVAECHEVSGRHLVRRMTREGGRRVARWRIARYGGDAFDEQAGCPPLFGRLLVPAQRVVGSLQDDHVTQVNVGDPGPPSQYAFTVPQARFHACTLDSHDEDPPAQQHDGHHDGHDRQQSTR